MANVIKKCDCAPNKWGRCRHNWVVRYRDEHGKQREKTLLHDQKTLANDLKTKAEHARRAGEDVYPARCPYTFGEYAARVIRMSPVSERTESTYLAILRNHLGSLAKRNLADVAADRTGVTNLLLVDLPASVGRDTVELAQIVITSTMHAAVANGDLDGHRLARIRLPRRTDEESVDPELIERLMADKAALLKVITDSLPPRLALAAWLSFGCGLRVSEALAVRLSDFSDDLTTLTVARQVLSGSRMIPLKARDPGKTRKVPVPVWTAERVREHVAAFEVTDYLFPGQRSRYTPRASLTRPWQKARAAAGMSELRYHDLRHAWCSRLLSEGVTSAEVAKMAGHRSSEVTEKVYFHFLPRAFDRAREVLDNWT